MTKQEILFALDITHPGGAPIRPGASWKSRDDLLQCWEGADGVPSMADLEIALAAHHAAEALITARATTRAALRAKWDSLPAWIRGPFHDKFAAANTLLDAGDYDAASAIIRFAEIPTGYSLEEVGIFVIHRDELLAGINYLKTLR